MLHSNTNQSNIPKKSQTSAAKNAAGIFSLKSLNIILGSKPKSYAELTEGRIEHYTKKPYETLSLDIQNFEFFHITKLGSEAEQIKLPNGDRVVPCEFEYKYTEDAIIRQSIKKWHYNLDDGNKEAKAYQESKSWTRRSIALVSLPIAADTNLKFYSRQLGNAAKHITPPQRNAVLVLWVEKIARDTESAGYVNSLFSKIMNG